jgi:hypothetical protein
MDFENPSGLGTGEEAQEGRAPPEQQMQWAELQGLSSVASWVAKLLGSSPGVPETWVI